jgi:hypothetical protein
MWCAGFERKVVHPRFRMLHTRVAQKMRVTRVPKAGHKILLYPASGLRSVEVPNLLAQFWGLPHGSAESVAIALCQLSDARVGNTPNPAKRDARNH